MKRQLFYGIISSILLLTGCSDTPEPVKEPEQKKDVSSDPFLNFSVKQITQNTKNEAIIMGVKEIAREYKDKVINIRVDSEEQRNTIIDQTEDKIEENQIELNNQRDLYGQQCLDIKNETQAKVCKDIDDRIDQATTNIQKVKETEKETIDQINIEEIKRLSVIKEEFIKTFSDFEKQNNIDLPDPF